MTINHPQSGSPCEILFHEYELILKFANEQLTDSEKAWKRVLQSDEN